MAETTSPIFVEDAESSHVLHLATSAPPRSPEDLVQAFAEASNAKVRAGLAAGGGEVEIDEILWECWAEIPLSALRPGADGSTPESIWLCSSTYRQGQRMVTRAELEPGGAEPAVVTAPLTPDQVAAAEDVERRLVEYIGEKR